MSLKIKGNQIQFIKSAELNDKQLRRMSQLSDGDKKRYALSVMGLNKTRVRIDKSVAGQYGADPLQTKGRNSILNRFNMLLDNSNDAEHKPMTRAVDSQWLGVEIECVFPGEDEGPSCDYCGGSGTEQCHNCDGRGCVTSEDDNGYEYQVDCARCDGRGETDCDECDGSESNGGIYDRIRRTFRREKITNCSVKKDRSLEGGAAVEVTVLFDARHGFDKIKKVCKILNDLGAEVNSTCGLHVHLDQFKNSFETSMEIGRRFGKFLPILSQLVPHSRRHNHYCKLGVSGTGESDERYYAVNMTSLDKHRTIEIRLHSGTTDARKIESWCRLLIEIQNLNKHLTSSISTFQGLIDSLNLSSDLIEYFDKRHQKFNPEPTSSRAAVVHADDDESQGIELTA